ncbi:MAG: hypothetical protein H7329_18990 [Opitutaceae bacterium]|nr:hypothetical protein [Cytophagales bacterium]
MQIESNNISNIDGIKVFSDQLLQLLSDNQLFINKIQKSQWNFEILPLGDYNNIINLLFNCSEIIAEQIKIYNGHVAVSFAVYLEMSNLKEVLEIESEFDVKKDVIQSHHILLDYLMKFMNDEIDEFHEIRKSLITDLHQSHTEIYKHLESFNK